MRYLCLIILLLAGCASTPERVETCIARYDQTAERDACESRVAERDERRAQDVDVWNVCRRVYASSNVPMVHVDHTHGPRDSSKPVALQRHEMKADILHNRCKQIYKRVLAE